VTTEPGNGRDASAGTPAQGAPGDDRFTALVQDHFDALMVARPTLATHLEIHRHDGELADLSLERMEDVIGGERRFLSELESIDPARLSDALRFEHALALHASRHRLFDLEVHRTWSRRPSASDDIGDGLFLLLSREFAPLAERLERMTERLEAAPRALLQVRSRVTEPPVRLWCQQEMRAAQRLPTLIGEVEAAGRSTWDSGSAELRRLERAAVAAREGLADYSTWIATLLPTAVERFALGAGDLETLLRLRDLDGLDGDAILAIGEEQLREQHAERQAAGRQIDPDASEDEIVARVKSDHPADFAEALVRYRADMLAARDFIVEHDLATLPPDETLAVVPTPEHLRSLIPFAAYFAPAAFDPVRQGVYVVTPSVDGDPRAMREHNRSSIVNTSIHEAYPGHHHQLSAALSSRTPSRLLVEAPEFVEGWGMYCERMMREHGFRDSPAERVAMATDAVWRSARIVLDIRLHRGKIGVPEAIDFLIAHTGFERPHATAEVERYTRVPGYNLSYMLGRVMLMRLREEEARRLGSHYSERALHDALLFSGSLPIAFHRRLLWGEGGGPTTPPGREPYPTPRRD
jgi:uncharacterized protein (DUF885 family)